jgi:hypothetical protein
LSFKQILNFRFLEKVFFKYTVKMVGAGAGAGDGARAGAGVEIL